MIQNGQYVADHLSASSSDGIDFENTQPNGVDLKVASVERIIGDSASFERDGYRKPKRKGLWVKQKMEGAFYRLYSGQHAIIYDETVEIPEGHVGRVYPRSRVMRSGCHLTSALWDQGYEGQGEGLLRVPPALDYVDVEVGASLAQMVFLEADSVTEQYDGSHQGERL